MSVEPVTMSPDCRGHQTPVQPMRLQERVAGPIRSQGEVNVSKHPRLTNTSDQSTVGIFHCYPRTFRHLWHFVGLSGTPNTACQTYNTSHTCPPIMDCLSPQLLTINRVSLDRPRLTARAMCRSRSYTNVFQLSTYTTMHRRVISPMSKYKTQFNILTQNICKITHS